MDTHARTLAHTHTHTHNTCTQTQHTLAHTNTCMHTHARTHDITLTQKALSVKKRGKQLSG